MTRSPAGLPEVSWKHVALGALLALAVAELSGAGVQSVLACAVGGFLAARLARHHGLLQGAATGAAFVVVAALLDTVATVPLLPGDTLTLIVLDTLHLGAGALGGWLATRS